VRSRARVARRPADAYPFYGFTFMALTSNLARFLHYSLSFFLSFFSFLLVFFFFLLQCKPNRFLISSVYFFFSFPSFFSFLLSFFFSAFSRLLLRTMRISGRLIETKIAPFFRLRKQCDNAVAEANEDRGMLLFRSFSQSDLDESAMRSYKFAPKHRDREPRLVRDDN